MRPFIILLTSLLFFEGQAQQNLVINGSFEEIPNCQLTYGELNELDGWSTWYDDLQSSPDVFNECMEDPFLSIPDVGYGFQYANTGLGFAGFIPLGATETILGTLSEPLVSDSLYYVSFAISLCDSCQHAMPMIGLKFLDSDSMVLTDTFLTAEADVVAMTPIVEKTNWVEVSSTYLSHGAETFFALGFFPESSSFSQVTDLSGNLNSAYYYVDDVVVRKANPNAVHAEETQSITVYPNPANSSIRISTSEPENPISVQVRTPAGQVIRQETFRQELDVSELPRGVYLLQLIFEDRSTAMQRFVKM